MELARTSLILYYFVRMMRKCVGLSVSNNDEQTECWLGTAILLDYQGRGGSAGLKLVEEHVLSCQTMGFVHCLAG